MKRSYRMVARAEAAQQTRTRVLEALIELFMVHDFDAITLEMIAERAGVTLQTVLRHFKSKDGLIAASFDHGSATVMASRKVATGAGRAAAVRTLIASYEQMGDHNWRLLRHEAEHPSLHRVLENARRLHRRWLEGSFGELLSVPHADRERRLDALFTVTDFYTWKLHRRDLGRTRRDTEAIVLDLIDALAKSWEDRA